MDVVVSTADHEFFGIAVCEAVWAGAIPIVPNRLSYVELFPDSPRYEDLNEAADQIQAIALGSTRSFAARHAREAIENLTQPNAVARIDDALENLCSSGQQDD